MKVTYENKWEQTVLHIDLEIPYEEDYQMKMLGSNQIKGLLKVAGSGRDGQSRYSFYTEGSGTMESRYSRREMKRGDVERFLKQLMAVIKEVKEYLLDPDQLLLSPEYIFVKDGRYSFCYLPAKENVDGRSLCESFHAMTEYFIQKLDHQDTEGIFLVYRLHKETFTEGYDIGKILEEYRADAKKRYRTKKSSGMTPEERRQGALSEGTVFCTDEEETEENKSEKPQREKPVKRVLRRIKSGRWGQWDDLITEMDGQSMEGNI